MKKTIDIELLGFDQVFLEILEIFSGTISKYFNQWLNYRGRLYICSFNFWGIFQNTLRLF